MLPEFTSGGIVFKKKDKKTLWLVTKSKPNKLFPGDYWRLPKGWIDDRDNGANPGPIASGEKKATEKQLQSSALREVAEEGGVEAEIVKKVGTMRFFTKSTRGQVIKFTTFYLMQWKKDLPEGFDFETEKVEWLSFEKAVQRLNKKEEKQMLVKANKLLGLGVQETLV